MKLHLKSSNEISLKKRYSKLQEGGKMCLKKESNAKPQDLVGIYGELAEIVGIDVVIIIYEHFKGQQVSFPTRLYSKDFIAEQVTSDRSQPLKKLATKYGYSERRLRQIIQEKK